MCIRDRFFSLCFNKKERNTYILNDFSLKMQFIHCQREISFHSLYEKMIFFRAWRQSYYFNHQYKLFVVEKNESSGSKFKVVFYCLARLNTIHLDNYIT